MERNLGYVLRIEVKGFIDGLDVGNERKRGVEKDFGILVRYKEVFE